MKSYEEVAKSVFEKSDKYFEEKALRAKRIKTAATAMSCFCLAAVLTVGAIAALNSNLTEYSAGSEGQPAEDNDIPEYTTTETEPLYTMPEPATDANGDPIILDVDTPDDIWEKDGETFSNGSINYDYIWQTPEEILGDNTPPIDIGSSVYIVYDGALYKYSSDSETDSSFSENDRYYAATGRYAYSHDVGFPLEAYVVKDEPDLIMIEKDYVLWEYTKVMDCNFEIDGEKYEIACSVILQADCDYGDMVMETEYFRVHEVLQPWNSVSEYKIKTYLINIYPLVRDEPSLFIDFNPNYPDYPPENHYVVTAWWLVLPCDAAEEMSHIDTPPADPSLPLNTLVGVTPDDIDSILAPAAAAAYSTTTGKSKSVFVAAEAGSEIYSLVDGVVVMAEYNDEYGCTVEVDIGNGKCVKHYNLSGTLVKVGDTVTRGQVIGHAGTTGTIACSGAGYTFITDK